MSSLWEAFQVATAPDVCLDFFTWTTAEGGDSRKSNCPLEVNPGGNIPTIPVVPWNPGLFNVTVSTFGDLLGFKPNFLSSVFMDN